MHRLRRLRAIAWRLSKWSVVALLVVVVLLLIPVGYVELACRGDARAQTYEPLIADPAARRPEANTYLTFPEWHIVYAYDGLAEALKTGDEHAFDYASSVAGFWRSACALMRVADEHGGADGTTRTMIHTIGVSFTLEMAAKAAYEESLGRLAAWVRGQRKTPQDIAIANMSSDYASFLRQTPWYQYPFERESQKLWKAPVDGVVRGWERRLAIGTEFAAKRVYARIIGGAAAAAPAQLVIRTIVAGLDEGTLSRIDGVKVVGVRQQGIEIETPRYDRFTRILADIAVRGGSIREIAGNDDIMATVTVPIGAAADMPYGRVIARMRRQGFPSERLIVDVKVTELATLLKGRPIGDPGLEHIFDY
jgi:hypothetical protein